MTKFGVIGRISAVALFAVLAAAPASAAEFKFYGKGELGYSFYDDLDGDVDSVSGFGAGEIDDTFLFGLGAGVAVVFPEMPALGLRADAVLSVRNSMDLNGVGSFGTTVNASVDSLAGMFSVYADYNIGGGFRPFIGAGVGFAKNELGTVTYTDGVNVLGTETGNETTEFAYQLMGGLTYDFGPAAFDVGYRYVDLGSVETSTAPTLSTDLTAGEIFAAVRIWF